MNVIFGIICHRPSAPLIYTLHKLSSNKSNKIILHVDSKSNLDEFDIPIKDNIVVVHNRIDIHWGTVTQINATLNILSLANEYEYDYFFLLSGDEIPITSQSKFHDFLMENSEFDFFEFQGVNDVYVNPLNRVKYRYPEWYFNREKSLLMKVRSRLFNVVKDFFMKIKIFR